MLIREILKNAAGCVAAVALVGCAADVGDLPLDAIDPESEAASADGEGSLEVGATSLALGSYTRPLPRRGSDKRVVDAQFLGWGMLYSMQLRTGALVDAITVSLYTPSNPNNRYSPGDPVFSRGPSGGTAGSPAPVLTCPGGYAAVGLYGRSGAHVDMLGLICTQIGSDGRPIKSTERPIGAYGGQGGSFFYDVCPDGEWLGGLVSEAAMKASGSNKIIGSVQGFCAAAS